MRTLNALALGLGSRPVARVWPLVARGILILGFANLTAVSAWIALYLPISPVPVTAQTLAVLLAGVCLGSRAGALAQVTYICEGLLGLSVFAGGRAGFAVLLGPTGGYLVGFVAAAFVVGWLAERGWRSRTALLPAALMLGTLAIYAFGAGWLAHLVPGGLAGAIAVGVLPFLPGDIVKVALVAIVVPSSRRFLGQVLPW